MNTEQLLEKMNKNREQLNTLEAQDWELGKKLLEVISSKEECLFVLRELSDSITRMYVADKLRMIRSVEIKSKIEADNWFHEEITTEGGMTCGDYNICDAPDSYVFERGVPRIVCAANKCTDSEGNDHIVIGARHYCPVMRDNYDRLEALVGKVKSNIYDQGFIDQFGTWYSREDAWVIAKSHNQIVWLCGGQKLEANCELFSENLY